MKNVPGGGWRFFAPVAALLLLSVPTWAQWVKLTVPGTPRKANGAPDLTAPAPRTLDGKPDLSGVWTRSMRGGGSVPNPGGANVAPLTSAAEVIFKERRENHGKDMPSGRCLPHGLSKAIAVPEPFKIIQTPALTLILHEEFDNWRQVFAPGTAPPPSPTGTWFGRSIGHWENDIFVIHTDGFIDDMWIDVIGHPATKALQITERMHRIDFGHLESQITIDDPGAYKAPWTMSLRFDLIADQELIEDICESERDQLHYVGN
jgi:hypothetical protein